MTRSGYVDEMDDQWALIRYRGAVNSAMRGKRGQRFFRELLAALDALPEKKLIAHELQAEGNVCALGALGKSRAVDMSTLDPEDAERVATTFDIAEALAREVVYMNDEYGWVDETPEKRFTRMRAWVVAHIAKAEGRS